MTVNVLLIKLCRFFLRILVLLAMAAVFFGLLAQCGPDRESVLDCLTDVPDHLGNNDPPVTVRFVKTCVNQGQFRGYLPVVILLPLDSTLRTDRLELILNGYPIPGLKESGLGPSKPLLSNYGPEVIGTFRIVEFSLRRTAGSREAWSHLVGGDRNFQSEITMVVSVGLDGGSAFPDWGNGSGTITFHNYADDWHFWAFLGLSALCLFLLAWMIPYATDGVGRTGAYSLSRLSMLYWSFLVIGGFLLVFTLTGEWDGVLTGQALLLLGLQGGTLAGALAIQKTKPSRKGGGGLTAPKLLKDILLDGDGKLRLHRFQNLAWHLILGVIFAMHVWENLWMPEFDDTLLVALGIGNGIYLGGKSVEL